jgi:hypothetical protein
MLNMKKKAPSLARRKTRAIELYASNSPFKPKIVQSKLLYKRKDKHLNTMFVLD